MCRGRATGSGVDFVAECVFDLELDKAPLATKSTPDPLTLPFITRSAMATPSGSDADDDGRYACHDRRAGGWADRAGGRALRPVLGLRRARLRARESRREPATIRPRAALQSVPHEQFAAGAGGAGGPGPRLAAARSRGAPDGGGTRREVSATPRRERPDRGWAQGTNDCRVRRARRPAQGRPDLQ